jgi:1-acyl-sn-glycerol-3-phosphate acyltransferase
MIRTVFYAVHVFFVFFFSFITLIPFFILRYITGNKVWENFNRADVSFWSWVGLLGTGSTFDVSGTENVPEGSAVFISNHQSHFDIFIILCYIKKMVGFIAKIELRRVPILNTWISLLHGIFINRNNMRDSYNTIEEGIKNLKKGYSLMIFPEGHRSKGPVPGVFKSGSFKLAILSNTQIVPVSIKDSYKIFEETGRIRPAHVTVRIHPPIKVEGLSEDEKRALPGRVAEIIKKDLLD